MLFCFDIYTTGHHIAQRCIILDQVLNDTDQFSGPFYDGEAMDNERNSLSVTWQIKGYVRKFIKV